MTTIPETHRDLLDAQVAVLGTVGASGRPQLSAIWFLAEGDTVKLSLNTSRQKLKNLQANPACSLLILDPANPYRYVELRGDAQITADPDYEFAKKVGAKYGGADLSEHDGPGDARMVVTLVPSARRRLGWRGRVRAEPAGSRGTPGPGPSADRPAHSLAGDPGARQ